MIAQQILLNLQDYHGLVRDNKGRFVKNKSISERICYGCGISHKSHWHLNHDIDNNVLCENCFVKIIHYPLRREIVLADHKKYIRFKNKRVKLQSNPRIGFCSKCGSKRFTHMHHWFYLVIMPWSCIVELCNICHPKQTNVNRDQTTGQFKRRLESSGF